MQSSILEVSSCSSAVASSSGLNAHAKPFTPRGTVSENEGRRIDDILRTMHHLVTVNDTETLLHARAWLGSNPDDWVSNGMDYTCGYIGGEDDPVGDMLDREDWLRDRLYVAPSKAKGCTYGRAKANQLHRR